MKSTHRPRIGFIGAGMIAQDHMHHMAGSGRCSVAAIADVNQKAADAAAAKHKIPKTFTDYRAMLDDPEIDTVAICTPPFLHRRMFMDALSAGKNVLIEKPLAITRADVSAMVKAAAAHPGLVICEASCRHSRLQPKFRFIKRIIDSGALGDIYFIHHNSVARHARPGIEYHPAAKWFLNKKLAGAGPILDWGVYDISFHLGILGDRYSLQSTRALTKNGLDHTPHHAPIFDVEEHACAFMEFDRGLTWYWERASNAHNEAPHQTRIYGAKGGLRFSYCTWESSEIEFFDVARTGKGEPRRKVYQVSMAGHTNDNKALDKHFLDCLIKGTKPAMPVARAAKHLDILFSMIEAAGESAAAQRRG